MCASRTLSRRSNTRGFDTPMRQLSPEGLAAQLPVALVNEHPKLRASKLDSEGRRLFGRLVEILAGHLQKRPAPTTLTDVSKMHKEAASRLSTYVHKATLADATYGAVDKKVRRSHWPPGTCKPASQDLLHAPPALISRATSHHLCCARMTQACHGFLCGCGSARLVGRSPGWPAPPAQHRPAHAWMPHVGGLDEPTHWQWAALEPFFRTRHVLGGGLATAACVPAMGWPGRPHSLVH